MSSKLSARAINLSLALRECDYWPRTDDEKLCRNLQMLYLDEVAQNGHGFLKRRLILQNFLKDEDVQDIFTLGEPLIFDAEDYPRLVVPKIVEAFQHLTTEPSFLDVSIVVLMKEGWANEITARMDRPAELWSQVYDGYLPCAACTMVEVGKTSCHGHFDSWPISACDYCNKPWTPLNSWASYAVEKFHVASKHFDKQLDVELYFTFGDPAQGVYAVGDVHGNPPTAPKEEKLGLLKVAIRLVDGVCGGSAKAVARKSRPQFKQV
ncbi:hypothetical protein AAVH_06800 [Aphelenchoides avenae]|nr:hypothetical protein AAVH_06800 [Aphelenchus avenae]